MTEKHGAAHGAESMSWDDFFGMGFCFILVQSWVRKLASYPGVRFILQISHTPFPLLEMLFIRVILCEAHLALIWIGREGGGLVDSRLTSIYKLSYAQPSTCTSSLHVLPHI